MPYRGSQGDHEARLPIERYLPQADGDEVAALVRGNETAEGNTSEYTIQGNARQFLLKSLVLGALRFQLIQFLLRHGAAHLVLVARTALGIAVARSERGGDVRLDQGRFLREQGLEVDEEFGLVQGGDLVAAKVVAGFLPIFGNFSTPQFPFLLMRTTLLLAGYLLLTNIASAGSEGSFTENKGQWPTRVFYRTSFSEHAVFVEQNAFTVVAWSGGGMEHAHGAASGKTERHRHTYRVRFVGADGPRPIGSRPLPGAENFFLGNDPAKWGTNAHRYQELGSRGLYPGIDLRLSAEGAFKYELLVHPGASPDIIALGYEGQDGLLLQDGDLLIETSVGTMVEKAPVAYQERNGVRIPVACDYELQSDRLRYSFPEGYDASLPLVIDPSLVFSTYSGSTSDNFAFGATYDDSGHLYASSVAFGIGYPTTLGAYQTTWTGGVGTDVVVTKFALDGSSLVWSTYLGGTGSECPVALMANSADELFILAVTGSADHPTTIGAYDQTFNGGPSFNPIGLGMSFPDGHDLVLARLSADGSSLIAGTFLGGSGGDGVNNITPLTYNYGDGFRCGFALDANGDPVVAVSTMSLDLPTVNAPQSSIAGGQDGYVFRMSAQLDTLAWATYLGGSGNEAAYGLCINSLGEVIVTGGTTSSDLPMIGPSFNGTFGGVVDGFVARYSASGDQLLSSTFLGTAAYDQAFFVDVDGLDAVIVLGQSVGGYPVTPDKYANVGSANFLQKLSPDLSTGEWSTVIGNGTGAVDISPVAFAIDYSGRLLVCGFGANVGMFAPGTTIGLPVTTDAFQLTTDGNDFYIAALSPEALSLVYATFLGGAISHEHSEGSMSRFDDNGDLYLAVCAGCGMHNDFPTTPDAWSATNNSANCNLAAVKFTFDGATAISESSANGPALIWPSPSDAFVHIGGCYDPPCAVHITDATGRVVARTRSTGNSTELSVERFAPGVYHAYIRDVTGARHARFLVR